ncbi:lipopolysaccharide kinase InaA family protein [Candidatus Kuenenia stuttgartensis]|uniref:lipopolysaccharide kinase InaA family protein n=1 Tax=Kuenenia stuttgartiensis TaxID=174633 RepID=UPI00146D4F53
MGHFYSANFISKEIAGAVDLIDFLNEQPAVDVHSKKSVIFTLAKLIRKMHDAGIYHADLHLKNMLLKKISGGTFEAYIIDLDKSTVWRQLTIGKRMKNCCD